MRLGRAVDPVVVPLLDRAGARLREGPPPRDASQLYAGWLHARAGLEGYPARLALRGPDGAVTARLNLDSLELPEATVSSLVDSLGPTDSVRIASLQGVPGVYQVLLLRLVSGDLLTVALGPKTRLLAADQLGALLDPTALGEPPYRIALSPPTPGLTPDTRRLRWKREGWVVHGERSVQVADGVRVTHAEVDLRGPFPLLVRGALVVVLDAAVLALIWLLAEAIAGIPPAVPSWRRMRRSFRVRVAVALAAFFLIPAIGFAAWEVSRLNAEADHQRDEAITEVLRDVLAATSDPSVAASSAVGTLDRLAARFRAELAVYRGGRLVAATDSVLAALAILAPAAGSGRLPGPGVRGRGRIRRRRAAARPEGSGRVPGRAAGSRRPAGRACGAPRRGRDSAGGQPGGPRVVLPARHGHGSRGGARRRARGGRGARPAGGGPAAGGARARARGAAAEAVRRAARGVRAGGGRVRADDGRYPAEPRGAGGIEAHHGCRPRDRVHRCGGCRSGRGGAGGESARRGTAGRRAPGRGQPRRRAPGRVAGAGRGRRCLPGRTRRRRRCRRSSRDGARRLAFALAPLGPEFGGAVLAVNDVTELSRAERVLAWGEMARQVAHEIKNPLTPDAARDPAPATGAPGAPRDARRGARRHGGAHPRRDRAARYHCAGLQPLRRPRRPGRLPRTRPGLPRW